LLQLETSQVHLPSCLGPMCVPQYCSSVQRKGVSSAKGESPELVPSASGYILALHTCVTVAIASGVAQMWIYSQLGATSMTIFCNLIWVVLVGKSLCVNCAIQDRHHHMKKNDSNPCKMTGQIEQIKVIRNKLLLSLPISIQCSVACHGNYLDVSITNFNTAATQIFQMDSPYGIPMSFVLQESGARLVKSMTRALYKNAASQRPVGGISSASANLHALKFRSMYGLFTASAALVYVLDHTTGQGVLCLGADIPKAWQQVSSCKRVELNDPESCSSEREVEERHTALLVKY